MTRPLNPGTAILLAPTPRGKHDDVIWVAHQLIATYGSAAQALSAMVRQSDIYLTTVGPNGWHNPRDGMTRKELANPVADPNLVFSELADRARAV